MYTSSTKNNMCIGCRDEGAAERTRESVDRYAVSLTYSTHPPFTQLLKAGSVPMASFTRGLTAVVGSSGSATELASGFTSSVVPTSKSNVTGGDLFAYTVTRQQVSHWLVATPSSK
eukprot:COSAG05_NODE_33_length_28089_cov_31.909289_22_plen_116_part_00